MERLAESNDFNKIAEFVQKMSEKQKTTKEIKEYKCKKCKDVGYIYTFNEYGLIQSTKECECTKAKRAADRIQKSGLVKQMEKCTFEKFNAYNNELKFNKALALGFAMDLDGNSILLLGQSGSGKTHLATAICKELLYEHKIPLNYTTYREIIAAVKPLTMYPDERIKALDKYLNIKALYIDDLFKGTATDTDVSIMFEILDYRYTHDLITIITSELTVEELLKKDEALIGRVIEKSNDYILKFDNTPNYRIQNVDERTKEKALEKLKRFKDLI